VHQDGVTGACAAEPEHGEEHGEEGLREGAGLLDRQRIGDLHRAPSRHHDLLGVAAAGEQRHRTLSELPAGHRGAALDHLAGALEAEDLGGTGGRRILPLPLQQVGAVDRGGGHPQPEVAGAERGRRHLGEAQHRLVAGSVEDDRLHGDR